MGAKEANKTSFKKGESGNPAGRPVGTCARTRFRNLVDESMPSIVEQLVANAKAGDTAAAKLLLDRHIPAIRPATESLSIKPGGTLTEQGERIIKQMSEGRATPDQALVALNVLAGQAKLIEQSEVMARLDQLEAMLMPTKVLS
jgi:hypothetical protein